MLVFVPQSQHAVLLLSDMPVFLYTEKKKPLQSVLSLETQAVFGWLKKKVCQTSKYVTVLDNCTELSLRTELLEFLVSYITVSFVCMFFLTSVRNVSHCTVKHQFLPSVRYEKGETASLQYDMIDFGTLRL